MFLLTGYGSNRSNGSSCFKRLSRSSRIQGSRVNRILWLLLAGSQRVGWRARYLKEVDAQEVTLRFWQEIYDDQGKLVEVHEKYPVDTGHRKV
jgi:hypothetical protein